MVELFHTTYISIDLAHLEIFHANVGKDGIRYVDYSVRFRSQTKVKANYT